MLRQAAECSSRSCQRGSPSISKLSEGQSLAAAILTAAYPLAAALRITYAQLAMAILCRQWPPATEVTTLRITYRQQVSQAMVTRPLLCACCAPGFATAALPPGGSSQCWGLLLHLKHGTWPSVRTEVRAQVHLGCPAD
mmetsp:Transcript_2682/g.4597  ORF Transcript_2682/g.4597 Transcript_2682/m.4597 type:complete len:139 (-) Transcript_2682:494-910(-)